MIHIHGPLEREGKQNLMISRWTEHWYMDLWTFETTQWPSLQPTLRPQVSSTKSIGNPTQNTRSGFIKHDEL